MALNMKTMQSKPRNSSPLFISSVNKKKLSKVKMTKNKILLAGATGYLGKHITQELLSRNLKQK